MKVAITGGASGIGAATVDLLLERGCSVSVLGRTKPDIPQIDFIPCDVGDDTSIAEAASSMPDDFDALISNAGLPPQEGLEADILSVNFFGLRKLALLFENKIKSGGAFVHVASRAGANWKQDLPEIKKLFAMKTRDEIQEFATSSQMSAIECYRLSKGAVIASAVLDTERLLAKNLRVNCISPAATNTSMLGSFLGSKNQIIERNIERIGRAGDPRECAQVIAFLAGSESSWIKGVNIPVDGGLGAMVDADSIE